MLFISVDDLRFSDLLFVDEEDDDDTIFDNVDFLDDCSDSNKFFDIDGDDDDAAFDNVKLFIHDLFDVFVIICALFFFLLLLPSFPLIFPLPLTFPLFPKKDEIDVCDL